MGIGAACCQLFAQKGYRVYNIDREPSREPMDGVIDKISDVSDIPKLQGTFSEVARNFCHQFLRF